MALIKCNECGRELSSTAENCPHCGYKTDHGRSVNEAKGYLVWWALAVVMIVVGVVMFLGNMEDYAELSEYLDHYKYFSDEAQAVVHNFWIGVVLLIGGIGDICIIWYKVQQMKESGVNGYLNSQDTRYQSSSGSEWECTRCYSQNSSSAVYCTHCGAGRPGAPRPVAQEKIPAWKRVQMEQGMDE